MYLRTCTRLRVKDGGSKEGGRSLSSAAECSVWCLSFQGVGSRGFGFASPTLSDALSGSLSLL
eukprot:464422-Rhodomonas_salina.1